MADEIDFQEVACLLCGGRDAEPSDSIRWRGTELHYVICRACGLKYMQPRPTRGWYLRFYEQEFWQEKVAFSSFTRKERRRIDLDEGLRKRIDKQRWRARRIADLVGGAVSLGPDDLVLDVGCAFGVTLDHFRRLYGCAVLGVEPSELTRDWARRELAIEFAGRSMEDLQTPQPFDGTVSLIIMSHVLENMVDPRAALASARRLLRPTGHLYIDTCNFYYNNAVNPYHPYIFAPETLEELLAVSGFRVVEAHHEPHPRAAEAPRDPYLAMIATPGESAFRRPPADIRARVADQALGIGKLERARAGEGVLEAP